MSNNLTEADTAIIKYWLRMRTDDLDEYVHDAKGKEAAEINNEGRVNQISYLLGIPAEDVEAVAQLAGYGLEKPED